MANNRGLVNPLMIDYNTITKIMCKKNFDLEKCLGCYVKRTEKVFIGKRGKEHAPNWKWWSTLVSGKYVLSFSVFLRSKNVAKNEDK